MKTILTALFAAFLCEAVYGKSSGLCTIPGSEGPCGVEPFIYAQSKGDPHGFTCHKFAKARYVGSCVGGTLEGAAILRRTGSGGESNDNPIMAVFEKGFLKTTYLTYYSWGIGYTTKTKGSGCVYFGVFDRRNSEEECIEVKRSMGEHLLERSTLQAVRSGKFDLSTVVVDAYKHPTGSSGPTTGAVPVSEGKDDPKVSGRGAKP